MQEVTKELLYFGLATRPSALWHLVKLLMHNQYSLSRLYDTEL